MRILGINPGVRGGLGIVEVNNGVHRSSSNAIDVQTVGIGAKERIDAIAMRGARPSHAKARRELRFQIPPCRWNDRGRNPLLRKSR